MLLGTIKPFIGLLFKKSTVISRWSLLATLVRLAILKRRSRNDSSVRVRLGGYVVNAPDYHTLSTLLKEKFVDDEYFFRSDNSKPLIIDGGANIGISVLYFKALFPEAQIHCFEPYEAAYKYLVKNVAENGFEDVHCYCKAISDVDGEVALHESDSIINASVVRGEALQTQNSVPAIKLSGFIKQYQTVDMVKLDVEGSEIGIIADLFESGVLQRKTITKFVIEYHSSTLPGELLVPFIEKFTSNNYHVHTTVLFPQNVKSDLLLRVSQQKNPF